VWFICQCTPLRQVIRSLLLNIVLRVDSMLSSEFLRNRVLDFDTLYGFSKIGKGVAPMIEDY
jgi:hypothetical protein